MNKTHFDIFFGYKTSLFSRNPIPVTSLPSRFKTTWDIKLSWTIEALKLNCLSLVIIKGRHSFTCLYIKAFWILVLTFSKAACRSFSCSGGILNKSTWQASFNSGITLRKINVAIKREQRGSAISHPNCWINIVDTITPTLPRVSANTCRNTPENKTLND